MKYISLNYKRKNKMISKKNDVSLCTKQKKEWALESILGPTQNLKRKSQRGCRPDLLGLSVDGVNRPRRVSQILQGFALSCFRTRVS